MPIARERKAHRLVAVILDSARGMKMVPGADAHCPRKILMSLENVFGSFSEYPQTYPQKIFARWFGSHRAEKRR